mgnify:CR=1 FL=1|jgi:hypothetical protein|tara:strand:+ start:171 stop:434 length:264 start_codon:yes stop_codon:yes gene_type:complete
MNKKKTPSLFGEEFEKEFWHDEWEGMPEFVQEQEESYHKLIIRFRNEEDLQDFATKISQKINNRTKSIWHPKLTFKDHFSKRYVDES